MNEKIQRLEDLSDTLRAAILEVAAGGADIDFVLWDWLHDAGLVDYCVDDEYADTLTERGAALVADYKRRLREVNERLHEQLNGAASLKDWNDLDSRIISDSAASATGVTPDYPPDYKPATDIIDYSQSVNEIARLQAELDASRAEVKRLRESADLWLAEVRYRDDENYDAFEFDCIANSKEDAIAHVRKYHDARLMDWYEKTGEVFLSETPVRKFDGSYITARVRKIEVVHTVTSESK